MSSAFHYLDLEKWPRKNQFHFFKDYELPFFEMTAPVRSEKMYAFAKKGNLSFFHCFMFLSLKAVNEIQEFRYRLDGEKVLAYETIHGGSTVLNHDETFSFCYFDYQQTFEAYYRGAEEVIKNHRAGKPSLDAQDNRKDLIHCSVIPWVKFTSFTHASRPQKGDSIPKIVFGKYVEVGGIGKMPVAVKVHHALMDGLHVGRFYQKLEDFFQNPSEYLQS